MNFYNEMMDANGGVRAHYKLYDEWLKATPAERIARKRAEAEHDVGSAPVAVGNMQLGQGRAVQRVQFVGPIHRDPGYGAVQFNQQVSVLHAETPRGSELMRFRRSPSHDVRD